MFLEFDTLKNIVSLNKWTCVDYLRTPGIFSFWFELSQPLVAVELIPNTWGLYFSFKKLLIV